MAKISLFHLKKLADQNTAKTLYNSNLAGLKKFTQEEMPEIVRNSKESQEALLQSLEKLAQASQQLPKK